MDNKGVVVRKKILYICKDFSKKDDGAQIYNARLFEALNLLDIEIETCFVETQPSRVFPRWKLHITSKEKNKVFQVSQKFDFLVISHEGLSSLLSVIRPNLFIIHNVFSNYESPNIYINIYYKFRSLNEERRILNGSNKVLVLSNREKQYIEKKFRKSVLCEPPGILNDLTQQFNFNSRQILLSGSYKWLPKKLSQFKKSQKLKLKNSFKLIDHSQGVGCIGVIEDNFVVGFKLKLIQMLVNGDYIFSRVKLDQELYALGLNTKYVEYFKNFEEFHKMIQKDFDKKDFLNVSKFNRSLLITNYTWDKIGVRILNQILD